MLKRLLLALVLCCVAVPAYATVDWVEDFDVSDATFWARWSESCQNNPVLSTDRAVSGTKSLKLTYNGHVGTDPGAGGCFLNRNLLAASETVYFKMMAYFTARPNDPNGRTTFEADSVTTKMLKFGQDCCYPNFWWVMLFGGEIMSVGATGTPTPGGAGNIYGSITLPQNQWVCLEGRITMNTPGVSNGIVQSWINDAQNINRTDLLFRPATDVNASHPANTKMDKVELYTQNGLGIIYYDDLAVSRDARIGCGSTPPPGDTTPPTPPTALTVQ